MHHGIGHMVREGDCLVRGAESVLSGVFGQRGGGVWSEGGGSGQVGVWSEEGYMVRAFTLP